MVLGARPVRAPEKVPVPVPFEVLESAVVGFCKVLQQSPRAVTEAASWAVTVPEQLAELVVMLVTAPVVTAKSVSSVSVVNAFSAPYAVPSEFVA